MNKQKLKQTEKELNQFEQFLKTEKQPYDTELLPMIEEFDDLPDLADSTDYNLNVFKQRN